MTETTPPELARRKVDGTMRTSIAALATNNMAFNGSNDCVVVPNKGVYVTDPDYINQTQAKEAVYRVTGTPSVVSTVFEWDRGKHPNGIAISADGNTLYVGLTGEGEIVKIALAADGTPSAPAPFVKTGTSPDGIATDTDGNVFVATIAGVEAYSSTGTKWGTIALPGMQQATSLAFGDAQGKTLFVGSQKSLQVGVGNAAIHKIAMRVAGVP